MENKDKNEEKTAASESRNETPAPRADYGDSEIDAAVAAGLKDYALKNYDAAADQLGRACELYSQKKGSENAQLLFVYGRALFRVAVNNSEVLGERAAAAPDASATVSRSATPANPNFTFEGDDEDEEQAENEEQEAQGDAEDKNEDKDKDQGDDEGDKAENGEEGEQPQEQDDFEDAWEVLDLARKLLADELAENPDNTDTKKQLAETYDLLGEVSLESENFSQAVADLKASLDLRLQVYPADAPAVAESHYKLSLAHEFDFDDPDYRKKAIASLEKALESVRARPDPDTEIERDLETRLAELRADTRGVEEAKADALDGLVGAAASEIKSQLVQAISSANDVTGLVRKKRSTPANGGPTKKAKVEPEPKTDN